MFMSYFPEPVNKLYGKMNFGDVIKLRISRWGDYAVYPGEPNVIKRNIIREKERWESQKRRHDVVCRGRSCAQSKAKGCEQLLEAGKKK